MKSFLLKSLTAVVIVVSAAVAQTQTWDCGLASDTSELRNVSGAVKATLSGGTLTISGIGDMTNGYGRASDYFPPWYDFRDSITSVVIANGVTSIGHAMFQYLSNLNSVTIPNSVTVIESFAFISCSTLTSVTIPNSVTSIGSNAFVQCISLTSVTIPNSVTSIGSSAFMQCISLTSVTIPNSVTFIGDYAFEYCNALTSITILGTTPPDFRRYWFNNTPSSICLYVPEISIDAYRSANVWKDFSCIKPARAVTFDSRGGSVVSSGFAGGNVTKPADPARTGYAFGGWYRDTAYTNPWDFDTDSVTSDITLYARWRSPVTVTFNSQGGSAVSSQSLWQDDKVVKPADPARTNYYFGGWYMDAACTNPWNFNTDIVSLDMTLYVRWSNEPISVLTPARVVPPPPKEEVVVITPVVVLAGEFTAGPNPVARMSGGISFFRQGRRVSGTLPVYDAAGNIVKKITVKDNAINNHSKRKIAYWDLTDKKGRPVSAGTYLVKGVIKTSSDGKSEKVSLILGVR